MDDADSLSNLIASLGPNPEIPRKTESQKLCAILEELSRRTIPTRKALKTDMFVQGLVPSYIDPDWRAEFDNYPPCTSFRDHLAMFRDFAKIHPDYDIRILKISTEYNPSYGHADVFFCQEVAGRPSGTLRETMSVFQWRARKGEGWKLYRIKSMRGNDVDFTQTTPGVKSPSVAP